MSRKTSKVQKPEFEEVYDYALQKTRYFIYQFAKDFPKEHQEEIEQESMLRIWRAYQRINSKTWKTFIYTHCKGAVIDYLRAGKGFKEIDYNCVHVRVYDEGEQTTEEDLAARYGQYEDFQDSLVDYEAIQRLIGIDDDIYMLLKRVLGFEIKEISESMGVSKEIISRKTNKLFEQIRSHTFPPNSNLALFLYAVGYLQTPMARQIEQLPPAKDFSNILKENDIKDRIIQLSFNFEEH